MIDGELLRAIQILAIRSVEEPVDEDVYEKICRWFSREFSTPLMEVENLDPIYVLTHFFKDYYQKMGASQDEQAYAEYEQEKLKVLFPEKHQSEIEKMDEWVKKLEKEQGTSKAKDPQGNPIDTVNAKLAESMGEIANLAFKQAQESLNLTDNPLKLPDSGSMGE